MITVYITVGFFLGLIAGFSLSVEKLAESRKALKRAEDFNTLTECYLKDILRLRKEINANRQCDSSKRI